MSAIDICASMTTKTTIMGTILCCANRKAQALHTTQTVPKRRNRNRKRKKKRVFLCRFLWHHLPLRFWPKDTWQLRSVYSVIIVYLSDSFTDLNILMVRSIQAWNQYRAQQTYSSETGLNMVIMAIASCAVLVFSKIITFAVWKATGNAWFGVLQFCDLYIFVEAYESHKCVWGLAAGHSTVPPTTVTLSLCGWDCFSVFWSWAILR